MHYYQFHIGDYLSATSHLSNDEDLAYRRLLDMYYDTEKPIPSDIQWVSRRLRLGSEIIQSVLNDMFECTDVGYKNSRADEEIRAYHSYLEKQKANGKLGGRPARSQAKPTANPSLTQAEPKITLTTNHKPITNVETKQSRGTRLAADWILTKEQIEFCKQARPDLNPNATADRFKDYWTAQPGAKGLKLDWDATWRNWVRAERSKDAISKPQALVGWK